MDRSKSQSPSTAGHLIVTARSPPQDHRWIRVKRRKRRFLAYAFPPRSPHPHRLAVPARHGFVRAAPTRPDTSRGRLPSASQSCCDRTTVQVSHLYSINKRLTAHRRSDARRIKSGLRRWRGVTHLESSQVLRRRRPAHAIRSWRRRSAIALAVSYRTRWGSSRLRTERRH